MRPEWWLEERGGKVGGEIEIDLHELALTGPAEVLSIQPCLAIPPGEGHIVTGRFVHQSANVYDLQIEGDPEPIGVTGNHPFYTLDRHDFVQAQSLRIGETLQTLAGPRRIISFTPRAGPQTVYNLEIHGQHVYLVGESGTLVHNAGSSYGSKRTAFGLKDGLDDFSDSVADATGVRPTKYSDLYDIDEDL